ncbi:MAG: diguanylate cyclase [Pseudomonadales bacterium]|nr:diguanylate cyclase [Pseudomonadales bacterium]
MDLLLDTVFVVNTDNRLIFISAACERMLGYSPEELLGRRLLDLVVPEDHDNTLAAIEQIQAGQVLQSFENRYFHKDGHIVHIRWSARWSESDQLRVAVAHDISEHKRSEALHAALYAISEAAHQAEDLRSLFPRIHRIIGGLLPADNFFVALYDKRQDSLSFPYFVDEFDTAPEPMPLNSGTLSAEVIRSGKALLLTPESRHMPRTQNVSVIGTDSLDWLGVPLQAGKDTIGALVIQTYSGSVRYTDRDRELLQFVSNQVASAITRTQLHERLIHAAGHDSLTGLANRGLLEDRLQRVCARVRRNPARFALLYLDLDKFKEVNDLYGHATGDQLLREVARRLLGCVRESDTVARMGGDEFVLLLSSIISPHDARTVAAKIRAVLAAPFELETHRLCIAPSIGIAVYPEDGDNEQALLHYADEAMYASKKASL